MTSVAMEHGIRILFKKVRQGHQSSINDFEDSNLKIKGIGGPEAE